MSATAPKDIAVKNGSATQLQAILSMVVFRGVIRAAVG